MVKNRLVLFCLSAFVLGSAFIPTMFVSSKPPVRVDEWAMFHHDLTHTGYSTETSPTTNNIAWSSAILQTVADSRSEFSPAVKNGRIYTGSGDGKLYSLDAYTGETIWSYQASGPITSCPAITDKNVFLTSEGGYLYCLNLKGEQIWNLEVGWVRSSPVVSSNKVYFGTQDGYAYCVNSQGGIIWSTYVGTVRFCSPAIQKNKLYIMGDQPYCLDAKTGAILWTIAVSTDSNASPVLANGLVYFAFLDGVGCYTASTGEFVWKYTTPAAVCSTPAIAYGDLFFGCCDCRMYCVDASTGESLWNFPAGTYEIRSSPAVANGQVYFSDHSLDNNGHIYCLDADTGDLTWVYNTGNMAGWSSPAVAYGYVYVTGGNTVYAFN